MGQHNGTVSSAVVDSAFGRLVEDLTARLQAGEAVDWLAVAQDHPDHADELAAVPPALEMLGHLSRAGDAALSGVATAPPDDDSVTGVLGDFRLLREVGRGGMGIVYEAEQISLGRRVALKVLPFAATMDPKQLQRFRNEAKAAASLHHEHVVPVYGVGCERGVHYYAMQFIDGITLAQVIAGRTVGEKPNPPAPFPKREGGDETGPEISPPFPLREAGYPAELGRPGGVRFFSHRSRRRPFHRTDRTEGSHLLSHGRRNDRPGRRGPRIRSLDGHRPPRREAG